MRMTITVPLVEALGTMTNMDLAVLITTIMNMDLESMAGGTVPRDGIMDPLQAEAVMGDGDLALMIMVGLTDQVMSLMDPEATLPMDLLLVVLGALIMTPLPLTEWILGS